MPWRESSVESERISFVRRALQLKQGRFSALCREYGISRPTGYLWLCRVKGGDWILESVRDRSRRPYHSPHQTPPELEGRVVFWRQAEGWGAKKIRELLLAEGIDLKVITINRILKRRGLVEKKLRRKQATQRFERRHPNELIQMDFKGDYAIAGGRCFPLSLLDDHSRYAVGLYALADQRGTSVQRCLIDVFERHGVPESMLMDHGSPWWSTTNVFGLTWLSVWLIKQGIKISYSAFGHPQTQGKVERFHETLNGSLRHHGLPTTLDGFVVALESFRRVYNHLRPHESLAMAVPASRYQPSRQAYNPQPPEWEYPEGKLVKKLNSQGVLECPGGRRFVCEALANEYVQIEEIGNHWLIKYRHQYIREINLDRAQTLPPVRPSSRKPCPKKKV